jgi:Mg2+-importing ATPase
MREELSAFWSISREELLARLRASRRGLSQEEAQRRLEELGANLIRPRKAASALGLLARQFASPIVLVLLFAAVLSFFLHDPSDAGIILGIILTSGALGFWQEHAATNAVARLLATVQTKATVLRDGAPTELPHEQIVPGDVVVLSAGKTIPADCAILQSRDLFVDETALTGESYPLEKSAGVSPPATPLMRRTNSLFMGTHVVSGSAEALAVHTGGRTEFARVSERIASRPPETEFERGIREFGFLLMKVTVVLVAATFAANVLLNRPVLESFLFSLALAVGLTPQLLPAVISVNLSHGARRMAQRKVIVRRLVSIENFGGMNVLCCDKTGTLTEGTVRLELACDVEGRESKKVLLHAYLNSFYETAFASPIDAAIRGGKYFDLAGYSKLDEEPYDFARKRLSVLIADGQESLMVTKGAVPGVLAICSAAEAADGRIIPIEEAKAGILDRFENFSKDGRRTLAVAYRRMGGALRIARDDEAAMTFLGLVVFSDPPKPGIVHTIDDLRRLGVTLKIITGDNRLVAQRLAGEVGLASPRVLTGSDLSSSDEETLAKTANHVDVFAEVEPSQKEQIVLALKKAGNVVGFMGDGINDAPAIHAADVGISVDTAVDVAREAADIVLLDKDLSVLAEGIRQGRLTFANTMKYVFAATSANFGNMFSMAGACLFLPFLPLLPKQVLLTNLMTDFPEMTIATDSVDEELTLSPRRWDIGFIRRFMVFFGILSSVFDYATFAVLLLLLGASERQFRTGWFTESVVSAAMVVLAIRSRRPFFKSRPGRYLLLTTALVVCAALLLPYTALAGLLGFEPLPVPFLLAMCAIVVTYVLCAEATKRVFYGHGA